MTAATLSDRPGAPGLATPSGAWLRSRDFDLALILGTAGLALAAGMAATGFPSWLATLILLDLWLLSFHHVIATYTRLCFDWRTFRTHWRLVILLPALVLPCVVLLALGAGLWTLATIYLYWQWFHYTRQSWGISRAYERQGGAIPELDRVVGAVALYLVPISGILYRSHQHPPLFFTLALRTLPVPGWLVAGAGIAALLAVAAWVILRATALVRGRLPLAHTLYMLTHFAIFSVGYVVISDITAGWLVVNIWHNVQYLLFVWLSNNRQFGTGLAPGARLMSYISQTRNAWLYVALCLGLSTTLYLGIRGLAAMPLILIIHQTINYHHYIVDALIWRRPGPRRAIAQASAP